MRRLLLLAVFALVLLAGSLPAFEAVVTIKKLDVEKGLIVVTGPGGQDHTPKLAKDIKVLGKDGKPLADGIKSKELKEGTVVTVTVEPEGGIRPSRPSDWAAHDPAPGRPRSRAPSRKSMPTRTACWCSRVGRNAPSRWLPTSRS